MADRQAASAVTATVPTSPCFDEPPPSGRTGLLRWQPPHSLRWPVVVPGVISVSPFPLLTTQVVTLHALIRFQAVCAASSRLAAVLASSNIAGGVRRRDVFTAHYCDKPVSDQL